MSLTVFQLSRSIGQYRLGQGVRVVNTLVLGNLCEYHHKSYIAQLLKTCFLY